MKVTTKRDGTVNLTGTVDEITRLLLNAEVRLIHEQREYEAKGCEYSAEFIRKQKLELREVREAWERSLPGKPA